MDEAFHRGDVETLERAIHAWRAQGLAREDSQLSPSHSLRIALQEWARGEGGRGPVGACSVRHSTRQKDKNTDNIGGVSAPNLPDKDHGGHTCEGSYIGRVHTRSEEDAA